MVRNTGFGGAVGLVDMDAVDWAAKVCCWIHTFALVLRGAANGVVEDEHS